MRGINVIIIIIIIITTTRSTVTMPVKRSKKSDEGMKIEQDEFC